MSLTWSHLTDLVELLWLFTAGLWIQTKLPWFEHLKDGPTGSISQRMVWTRTCHWRKGGAAYSHPVAIIVWPLPPETHALLKGAWQLLLIWTHAYSTHRFSLVQVSSLSNPVGCWGQGTWKVGGVGCPVGGTKPWWINSVVRNELGSWLVSQNPDRAWRVGARELSCTSGSQIILIIMRFKSLHLHNSWPKCLSCKSKGSASYFVCEWVCVLPVSCLFSPTPS